MLTVHALPVCACLYSIHVLREFVIEEICDADISKRKIFLFVYLCVKMSRYAYKCGKLYLYK